MSLTPTVIQLDGNSIGKLAGNNLNYVCQVVAQAAFEPCDNANRSHAPKERGGEVGFGCRCGC